ncbi:MAG TPA: hypothetical protein VH415_13695 [Nitrososphaeraceae archaeon]
MLYNKKDGTWSEQYLWLVNCYVLEHIRAIEIFESLLDECQALLDNTQNDHKLQLKSIGLMTEIIRDKYLQMKRAKQVFEKIESMKKSPYS